MLKLKTIADKNAVNCKHSVREVPFPYNKATRTNVGQYDLGIIHGLVLRSSCDCRLLTPAFCVTNIQSRKEQLGKFTSLQPQFRNLRCNYVQNFRTLSPKGFSSFIHEARKCKPRLRTKLKC